MLERLLFAAKKKTNSSSEAKMRKRNISCYPLARTFSFTLSLALLP